MAFTQRLKPFAAPARYIFQDPDTRYLYKAKNKESLFRQIIDYRDQNRLAPIIALEYVLEAYWCSLPENAGLCEKVKLKRGLMHYIKGGISLIENLYYGEKNIVAPEKAEKRAKICIGCSLNVFPDKDKFIQWSDEIAEASVGDRKVSVYEELGNCEGCTCPLRAKVWWKGDFKLKKEEIIKMHGANPRCWQLEIK